MQINSTKQPLEKNKESNILLQLGNDTNGMILWKHTGCQEHPIHLPAQTCYTSSFCRMPGRSASSEWVRPREAGSDQKLSLSNFTYHHTNCKFIASRSCSS